MVSCVTNFNSRTLSKYDIFLTTDLYATYYQYPERSPLIVPMQAQRGSGGLALLFLTPAKDDDGWTPSRPGYFNSEKGPLYLFYRRLNGPQTGLEKC